MTLKRQTSAPSDSKRILTGWLCVLPLTLWAQRDFTLVKERNPWLAGGHAAALTTYADSNIVAGDLRYHYEGGNLHNSHEGQQEHTAGVSAASYYRLHSRVVSYADIVYQHFAGTQMSGSAFAMARNEHHLMPFDIVEVNTENAGKKVAETIALTGGLGWNVWKHLSLGTRLHYVAGHYAKQKDLRHENALMQLHAEAHAFWQFSVGQPWGVSAAFQYQRQSESVSFRTYGTTDHVYQSLIDYANGMGVVETYNGSSGFTDKSEQPIHANAKGMRAGTLIPLFRSRYPLFVEGQYAWRDGYYGRISQYTLQHLTFNGRMGGLHLRYTFSPQDRSGLKPLQWIEARWQYETLQAFRTNYQESKKGGVASYTYHTPTQVSDKQLTYVQIGYVGYWKHLMPDLYAWELRGGTDLWQHKATAYRFPDQLVREATLWRPYLQARYNHWQHSHDLQPTHARVWHAELGVARLTGKDGEWQAHAAAGLEFPLRALGIRPHVTLQYDLRQRTHASRHAVALALGIVF